MNVYTKFKHNQFPTILLIGTSLILSSCTEMPTQQGKLSEHEVCSRMKGIMSDHRTQFKHYKKSLRRAQTLNTWSAVKVFPSAESCQIWEWGNGLHNYICNWQAKQGKKSAHLDYSEGNALINSCLGLTWKSASKATKSGGESTIYYKPGIKTAVSIRYFREPRNLMEKWQTVLTIGNKNKLKAKLQ